MSRKSLITGISVKEISILHWNIPIITATAAYIGEDPTFLRGKVTKQDNWSEKTIEAVNALILSLEQDLLNEHFEPATEEESTTLPDTLGNIPEPKTF